MAMRGRRVIAACHTFIPLKFLLRRFGLAYQYGVKDEQYGQKYEEDEGIDEEDDAERVRCQ